MTAKATKVFAPVLAEMERAVGNTPNIQIGAGKFANGLIQGNISQPRTNGFNAELNRALLQAVREIQQIPVVVAESDISSTQDRVRRIKVTGDLGV